MSGKKDNKKEKLKSLKKADERLKKEKKGVKKTKRKRGSGKKIAVGTAAAAVCILAAGYVAGAVYYQNRFYPGTEINGVKCGGQTVAEVKKDVKETSETYTLTIQEKDDKKEILQRRISQTFIGRLINIGSLSRSSVTIIKSCS